MKAEETLITENMTYEREKANLLASGSEGRFVLIHGNEVVGVWGTYEDALREGYGRFGLSPFLVKQIQSVDRVQFIAHEACPSGI
jgi:hypothetical protein